MATAEEVQIGWDVVRARNVMHDLLNVAAFEAREKNQSDGTPFRISVGETSEREATLEELQDVVTVRIRGARSYYGVIMQFRAVIGEALFNKGLEAQNITDTGGFLDDLEMMNTLAGVVAKDLVQTKSKLELQGVGTYLDQNMFPLPLMRRTWCLGG